MRPTLFSSLALLAVLALSPVPPARAATALPGPSAPPSFADLAERLLPAVVNISSTQKILPSQQQDEDDMPDMQQMPQFPPGSPF